MEKKLLAFFFVIFLTLFLMSVSSSGSCILQITLRFLRVAQRQQRPVKAQNPLLVAFAQISYNRIHSLGVILSTEQQNSKSRSARVAQLHSLRDHLRSCVNDSLLRNDHIIQIPQSDYAVKCFALPTYDNSLSQKGPI